jgi:hypothetical protein
MNLSKKYMEADFCDDYYLYRSKALKTNQYEKCKNEIKDSLFSDNTRMKANLDETEFYK